MLRLNIEGTFTHKNPLVRISRHISVQILSVNDPLVLPYKDACQGLWVMYMTSRYIYQGKNIEHGFSSDTGQCCGRPAELGYVHTAGQLIGKFLTRLPAEEPRYSAKYSCAFCRGFKAHFSLISMGLIRAIVILTRFPRSRTDMTIL